MLDDEKFVWYAVNPLFEEVTDANGYTRFVLKYPPIFDDDKYFVAYSYRN